ncbi:hypothetical protein CPT_Mater65 [Bacillus phage Mater]|uniref:Uncharacterized protein n=1 Tax=Bacillus phage Mater TaxID=1540090 RepID=A0A0A0RMM8_9CAUD|nr:hypothetical protein CPT_Mater65 [Bacillus phage Mater]AIW03222.1 hypothetical protein CPT_Mater65 [Bacillus phage Mater]
MFNILGKFFFFYMVTGAAWTMYNKYMYGQSNVDEYSTKVCTALSLAIVIVIEVHGLINKKKGEEDKAAE